MLPVPFPSLTQTFSYQLLGHALSRLGIDIEQSTPVPVLAPWAAQKDLGIAPMEAKITSLETQAVAKNSGSTNSNTCWPRPP